MSTDHQDRLTNSAKQVPQLLLNSTQLEPWQRDTFIISGHRRRSNSFLKCFHSLFYLHNEFVNTHSHLWAALFYAYLLWRNILAPPTLLSQSSEPSILNLFPVPRADLPSVSLADTVVFAVFLLGAVSCLGFSATYHCCSCHSPAVSSALNRLDHLGIVVLIVASFCPALFYGFFCEPMWQKVYITSTATLGAGTAYAVFAPRFRNPEMKRDRAYLFIALGLSGVWPIAHALLRDGWQASKDAFGLQWLLAEGLFYIAGALLYAERCPEKWSTPGRFDLFGSSHQIFHLLINLASFCHWVGIAAAFQHRHVEKGGLCLI